MTLQKDDVKDVWEQAAEGITGLEEFIGTIEKSEFMLASDAYGNAPNPAYGDSIVLVLENHIEQAIDPPDYKFDTSRVILSVGKAEAWTLLNGGEEIVNSKGTGMGNSKYQQFVKRVTKELKVPVQERGLTPYQAGVWMGIKFHWKRETQAIAERLLKERADRGETGGKDTTVTTLPQQWLQDTLPPLA